MNIKQVMDRIEDLARKRHMSLGALMDNAELSTTIYQWRKTKNRDTTKTPSLKSIEKVCKYLNISLSQFFADEEEELTIRQQTVSNKLKQLNDDELGAIENLIETFIRNRMTNNNDNA